MKWNFNIDIEERDDEHLKYNVKMTGSTVEDECKLSLKGFEPTENFRHYKSWNGIWDAIRQRIRNVLRDNATK